MKVLHVIDSMNPLIGGPCQGIRNSIAESKKLGCYKEVVCLDAPTEEYVKKDNFPIYALGPHKGPWRYSSELIPWLIENLERYDTIIVNGLWLFSSYAVWKAMRILKKTKKQMPKVFIMPHGMLDPWFQKAKGRKWKSVRNWLYWKLIESKVVNDANGILFTCETELLLARKPFRPYNPKREINIGYGIEQPPSLTEGMCNAFLEKCPEVRNQSYLLFLSRIHYKKGVDLLVKAYANLMHSNNFEKREIPKLVIAGPGIDSSFGNEIKQLVLSDPLLKQSVFFPGMLAGEAKWGAFYGCDAFILPSHQENFGIAVVEALACGKPALISNQVNIWSEVAEYNAGIVSDDSIEGTKIILLQWLSFSISQKKDIENNAKILFEEKFSITKTAMKFFSLLAS